MGDPMNDSRISRLLIWTGPVFGLLFLVLGLVVAGDEPSKDDSTAKILAFYNDHSASVMTGVFLSPLAAALIILFAAELRSRARAGGASSTGASAMLGGAVVWGASIVFGSMVELGLQDAGDDGKGPVAQTLVYLNDGAWVPMIAGLAVFLIGAGIASLGSRMLPAWLGWIALAVGVVSLAGPGGFVGFFVAPVWVIVTGVVLALRRTERTAATPASEPVPA
jgi:hypothetical protein